MEVETNWPQLRMETVERVRTMRWFGLALTGTGVGGFMVIVGRATQPRALNDIITCPTDGSGPCAPMVVPPSMDSSDFGLAVVLGAVLLTLLVLGLFGPATRAVLRTDGHLVLSGGLLRYPPVKMASVERISVGAVMLRGYLFVHCGRPRPVVMLAPVDGITRLIDEARQRSLPITLDGL